MKIGYLSHPYSAATKEQRSVNVESALAWLRFFVDHTRIVVLAPWIPYVLALDDTSQHYREIGLEHDLEMVRVADLVLLVGGEITGGMHKERGRARALQIPVLNLTRFTHPPGAERAFDDLMEALHDHDPGLVRGGDR